MREGRSARLLAAAWALVVLAACQSSRLPASLADDDFWRLVTELSEAPGAFRHSDNIVSNETHFSEMIRLLGRRSGAFIGVGPEQNFSYIAGLRPAIAFIVDIRGENRALHFLYKALFEIADDRADFLSRLFSRRRPPHLSAAASPQALVDAYQSANADRDLFMETLALIRARLVEIHRVPLSSDDLAAIDSLFEAFYEQGLAIHYRQGDLAGPAYAALITNGDIFGGERGFLADQEGFRYVQDLHRRNLIIPLVGDFAGSHTLRRVGELLRDHDARVAVFYGSNVEVYLSREQAAVFCATLIALPYDARSWFIGNKGMQPLRSKVADCAAGSTSRR